MKPDIRIFKNLDRLSHAAAETFVEIAVGAVTARGRTLVALSGGGTPSQLYRLLADEPNRGKVAWEQTFVFWGDERCVPPNDEGSNYYHALDLLLSHVPIPTGNIQRIKGEREPAEAARDYAHILSQFASPPLDWPRFDLLLLGMGGDGHTASLFPGSPVEASTLTLAVAGDYQGRPAQRVTLTPPVLNAARQVIFLVSGGSKAATLANVLKGDYHPERLPAQRIHPKDGKVTWLVDEAAASML